VIKELEKEIGNKFNASFRFQFFSNFDSELGSDSSTTWFLVCAGFKINSIHLYLSVRIDLNTENPIASSSINSSDTLNYIVKNFLK